MRRRRLLLAVTVLIVTAGAIAGWHVFWRSPAVHPTDGPWTATVSTIAGAGWPGFRDGDALRAAFSDPFAVAVSRDGTTLYIADAGDNNGIRQWTAGGVTTLAGGGREALVDGRGAEAAFHTPSGLTVGPDGSIYVADTGNHAIRRVTAEGAVTTVAGGGLPGYRDGAAIEARFDAPMDVVAARDGTIYVADTYNDRIRRIGRDGTVSTVAGSGVPGFADGAASSAQFDTPCGVAVNSDGSLIVADTNNHVLRRLDVKDGLVSTIVPVSLDGSDVSLFRPVGVAIGRDDVIYVTDRRGRILQVGAEGRARVLAGWVPDYADGVGSSARFFNPSGIAADSEGALFVADAGNYMVRRIAPPALYPPDLPRSPLSRPPAASVGLLLPAPLPWPLNPQLDWHEVTGTMGEPRGNTGGDGRDRFHAGVDIRADVGAPVIAVREAKIDNPLAVQGYDTLNESLSLGAITYVHIRVGRDRNGSAIDPDAFTLVPDAFGQIARVRVRRGTRFRFGQTLGTVNRFSHVHLNTGPAGREVNPLLLRPPGFADTVPPRIAPNGVRFVDDWGLPFPVGKNRRPLLAGRVRIIVDTWDQANGNSASRRLGLFRLGYEVLDAAGHPMPSPDTTRTTIRFDRLPRNPEAPRLVYAEGSGIAGQGNRRTRYLYVVTNRLQNGVATEDFWDTRTLAPGAYTVRIIAADAAGNEAVRDVRVTIAKDGPLAERTL